MHPGSYAIPAWTITLGLSAPALGGSAAMQYPIPGPDYVVERVAALPQVTFRAIVQTGDGYLWIGKTRLVSWSPSRNPI
jgi:hypothetical protein